LHTSTHQRNLVPKLFLKNSTGNLSLWISTKWYNNGTIIEFVDQALFYPTGSNHGQLRSSHITFSLHPGNWPHITFENAIIPHTNLMKLNMPISNRLYYSTNTYYNLSGHTESLFGIPLNHRTQEPYKHHSKPSASVQLLNPLGMAQILFFTTTSKSLPSNKQL